MTLFALVKLVHVASAVWFVSGLLGRAYALGASARSNDIRITRALADLSGRFENTMVIPGSIVVFGTGLLTAVIGGFPLLGPIQGGAAWPLAAIVIFVASMLLVPTVFLPRGRLFGAALDDAMGQVRVTDRLRAAFADRVVVRAHQAELLAVAAILALMVLKPF